MKRYLRRYFSELRNSRNVQNQTLSVSIIDKRSAMSCCEKANLISYRAKQLFSRLVTLQRHIWVWIEDCFTTGKPTQFRNVN